MNIIFGIDLGTTYSCIAVVDDHGQEIVIPNSENNSTTPSVVYFQEGGGVLVGESAKQFNKLSPARVVEAVKRHMGDPNWRFAVDGKSLSAQEISALILEKVAADAAQVYGAPVKDVVITCPAYFGIVEREATREAGVLAGLTVHNIISEPTAAAYSYGSGKEVAETLLVYDLGGGTFDVTVIDAAADKVVAVDGNKMLGGKDWDAAIVDYWVDAFATQTGVPGSALREDLETFQGLFTDAENAKIRLSTLEKFPTRIRHGSHSVQVELTRQQFEQLTAPLLEGTIQRSRAVLAEAARLGHSSIDAILLVGGSTFMPQVEARLKAEFNLPLRRKNPNQIVAMGAALRGHKAMLDNALKDLNGGWAPGDKDAPPMTEAQRDQLIEQVAASKGLDPDRVKELVNNTLSEVAPKSFGLKLFDTSTKIHYVDNAILRNSPVPTEATREYRSVSKTTSITLEAFENLHGSLGRVELEDCESLGDAVLQFPQQVPENHPFQVVYRLTADGLLNIEAHDPATGARTRGEFRSKGLMTEAEMAAARARLASIRAT